MPNETKRILCVDDYQPFRMLTRITLEAAGYEVESASDGEEAITRAQEQKFDLIILDLLMPRTDGFKVFNEFKELSVLSRTPILILTVLGLEPQVQSLVQQGAHHLRKDDAPRQLLPTVRRLIG